MIDAIKNKKINIIFLDVDGVLNIMSDSYRSTDYINLGTNAIEIHLMQRLEFLMEQVENTFIVLSSSWGEKQFLIAMQQRRFKYIDKIIGRTGRDIKWRGNQIKDWLDETDLNIINYVVLEDEPIDVCGDYCNTIPKEKVVHVNMDEGLSHENILEAISILKS